MVSAGPARRDIPSVVAIVVALLLSVPVAVPTAAGTAAPRGPSLAAGTQVDADDVLLAVSLRPDGSAAWRVEHRVRLDDENATRAFEGVVADVRANRSRFEARFADRMRRTAAAAENATGRGMAIRNVTVRTGRQQIGPQYGVLAYTFEWTGFAAANDTHVRAGDALAGLFLDRETSLRVDWPAGYRAVAVAPAPDDSAGRAVTWRGPAEFGPDRPRVVLSSTPPPGGSTPTAAGAGPGADAGDGDGRTPLPAVAALLVALFAVGGAAGWLYVRRRGPAEASAAPDDGRDEDRAEPPEELLSSEERVLRLLEERGGRMRQREVTEELDWTDARTSQVVGDLREAGEVESFRLGRENVLALPDEDDT